ncbi:MULTISPECIES: hypothetical protein [Acinetobacter]|nr:MULTISPECIES: hypothetical protein [Acinetobacter]VTX86304.1 Uncharacterised protein [Acinetobacter ursingii]
MTSMNFCSVFDVFTAQVWWGDNRPPLVQILDFMDFSKKKALQHGGLEVL